MNAVAVGANRSLPVSSCDRLPVDALSKRLLYLAVTLRAGQRHVELENCRFRIARRENFMGSVAIGADRCLLGSRCHCLAMHALLIRQEGLRAVPAGFHHKLLPVTYATRRWDVGMIHFGFRIACRQQFMRTSMTIGAGCGMGVT